MITETFKTLTDDLCFKYVFSKKEILEDFINSFLEFINSKDKFEFSSITPESFIMPNNNEFSMYFGDIIANTNNDENYISLEMFKNTFTKDNYNKSFAYMVRLFDRSIKNNNYKDAKKVYSINLIKNNFRRINNKLVNIYKFKNEDNKQIDNGNIELYLIRLDKLDNIQYTENERFIRWLKIINAKTLEELKKYCKGDEIMSEANKFVEEWCRESNKNGFERYIAEQREEAALKAETKGKKSGLLEAAKNMLSLNINIENIKKATGLSDKELNKLKKEIC